jgi:hypothetical protein
VVNGLVLKEDVERRGIYDLECIQARNLKGSGLRAPHVLWRNQG